ncbi:hypothetical protein GCM10009718_08780 [Isoptericola halotolerans]|uniref:L,D-TPase catalytic domain-containing protein n=1 Tax=Isoptericola halotolerans TaxID=300560 RepID=A0ABX2A076_9MICO|nr:L,D-transpeptidase family protein [Isoptericola halotolerans]NOV96199.1 hypothetical protein [Isoptericola halotolerans]
MTIPTSLRRGTTAAATALALLVVPGCAALSEISGSEAQATTSAAPSGEASEPTSTTTPSEEPPDPPPVTPSADASPSASPDPTRTAEPSTEPEEVEEAEEPEEQGAQDEDERAEEPDESDAEGSAGEVDEEKAEKKKPDHLERGATGTKVRALQEDLIELGYYLPEADGSFGPQTQQAVWALQKAAGLGRDAVVGPKTRQALKDGARPSPQSSKGKVVEIDLDRQLLLAVEDGRVVRTLNASSGNGESFEAKGRSYRATTPRGTFSVYMERDYLHESTLELGAMYRPKYFTGGIAVHGSPSIPPWPASHGCIRVSNSAMNWLWDDWGMPQGTTVVVY